MRVNPNGIERRSAREAMKTRNLNARRRRGAKPKRINRPLEPNAAEAIDGLDAALVVAAQYGMEIARDRERVRAETAAYARARADAEGSKHV